MSITTIGIDINHKEVAPDTDLGYEKMQRNEETKKERGCLLTSALVLSLLGALFNAFLTGAYTIVNTPQKLNQLEYWLSVVCFLANAIALFYIYFAFKMQKKGAYGLLAMAAITVVTLLLDVFLLPPINDLAKSGAGWMLIMVMGCILCSVVIASHIKKME